MTYRGLFIIFPFVCRRRNRSQDYPLFLPRDVKYQPLHICIFSFVGEHQDLSRTARVMRGELNELVLGSQDINQDVNINVDGFFGGWKREGDIFELMNYHPTLHPLHQTFLLSSYRGITLEERSRDT